MAATRHVLSTRQLNRATLARQMLLQREGASPAAAVEHLMGMQAQEARPPFVGLWSRLNGFRRNDFHQALVDREIVRGTLLRGTLHCVSATDYLAFRMAIQPVLDQAVGVLGDRSSGLEPERVLPVARDFLREQPRTFAEIRSHLVGAFPEVNERALGFTVRMQLPLVMAPIEHRWSFPANAGFVLAEDWLGEPLAEGDATEALALRYLAAFGPASVADFQTWSGLQRMKTVFGALRPRLVSFADERGRELFDLPDAPRPDAETPAAVRYLPEFDNLLLSHADRTRVIADEHRNIVYQKGNLRLLSSFLVDGRVAGTWRAVRKRKAATLQLSPFAPLTKPVIRDLEGEGEALLRFVEDDATEFAITFTS